MRLLVSLLIVFAALPAAAQDIGITVLEHGIYTAETVRTERLPNGFSSNIVQNICHVATTEQVPAKLGVQFGFRYRLDGAPVGAAVELTRVTHFPTALKPPSGTQAESISQHKVPMLIGATSYIGYGLDHDWEVARGVWTLELWRGDRLLAQQQFEIGDGGELPAERPKSNDNNCFQLSVSLPGVIRTGGMP